MAEQLFAGQVAIVTGAGSGIGRAIARRLAAGGARVAAIDLDLASAEGTARLLRADGAGGEALPLRADVSRGDDVREVVRRAREELGVPAILVNNAGISRGGHIWDVSEADWDLVMG